MTSSPARRLAAALPALLLLALIPLRSSAASPLRFPCPKGYERAPVARGCVPMQHPESFAELAVRDEAMASRTIAPDRFESAAALRAALGQRTAMIRAGVAVPGSSGSWTPYGKGPLVASDPRYGVSGEGLPNLSGRIDSLDFDPVTKRLFAAFGNGGVWTSADMGKNWTSIGEDLPRQINGSLAWTSANGGTLVVSSGEAIMAGGARTGLGAYRTTDLGRTWQRAPGVPDGALGFQTVVDPKNPKVIYIATSKGLFRSSDGAVSFTNVRLPTGDCAGKTDNQRCILANMVTDVVVQGPDTFGHAGGRVLAVVGYRAGARPFPSNPDLAESPWNGLYRSDTGAPGTFSVLSGSGFASQPRIGRTELGVAVGPAQDHNYVYAVVEDAIVFRGGFPTIDAPDDAWTGVSNTTLNGIYVSNDFGSTWKLMADAAQIADNPASGSALVGTGQATLYAPGVQSWYNEWIKPDPTRQTAAGVPTRLTFGLEEVWQNELTDQPQDGTSSFKVIGKYYSGDTCAFLDAQQPVCPTSRQPSQTTTTHPDQHDAIYVPDGQGGVTLVVGNDGGSFTQHAASGEEFDNSKWGTGANDGFNTLLPYHARISKDGTVYMGLQDNGTARIEPDTRKQYMTYGGDGTFVAVDPDNSDIAWESTQNGAVRSTIDGGKTWNAQPTGASNPGFVNPYAMDPTDANHLLTAGSDVVETVDGTNTCQTIGIPDVDEEVISCSWKVVFDLGTRAKPGDAAAEASGTDPNNIVSGLDVRGAAAYVAFCGPCSVMNTKVVFGNGIATNVGGDAPPAKASADGWHIAAAKGLPNRTVNSVEIDPADPKTITVTLGGYDREWRPPGSYGDKNPRIGHGNVFRSTDAGNTFTDVSGTLPSVPANWVTKRGSQLIVGTDIGAFMSSDVLGTTWAPLADGLPAVPVTSLQVSPGDPNLLIASTFGRGVYAYRFPAAPFKPGPQVKGDGLAATGVGDEAAGTLLLLLALGLAARMRLRRREQT